MRHRNHRFRLGRVSEHRTAMLRNMLVALFRHERIETTEAKAKAVRGLADHMVTLAKRESLHARRQALSMMPDTEVVRRLFDQIGARYADRHGGYTRIIHAGVRATRASSTPASAAATAPPSSTSSSSIVPRRRPTARARRARRRKGRARARARRRPRAEASGRRRRRPPPRARSYRRSLSSPVASRPQRVTSETRSSVAARRVQNSRTMAVKNASAAAGFMASIFSSVAR